MKELIIPFLTIIASGLISGLVAFLIAKKQINAELNRWKEERKESYRKKIIELRMKTINDFMQKSVELEIYLVNKNIKMVYEDEVAKKLFGDLAQILFSKTHILSNDSFSPLFNYISCFVKKGEIDITGKEIADKRRECVNLLRKDLGLKELDIEEGLGKFFGESQ